MFAAAALGASSLSAQTGYRAPNECPDSSARGRWRPRFEREALRGRVMSLEIILIRFRPFR